MLELLAKRVTAGQRSDFLAALAKRGRPAEGGGGKRDVSQPWTPVIRVFVYELDKY